MVRIALGAMAFAVAAACASAPEAKTPQQMMTGKWSCATESEGVVISGVFDYQANGLATSTSNIDVDAGAVKIALTANADSTWGFDADGKMTETVTAMKLTSAKMAGQEMDKDMVESLVQPMIDQVVGESSTSTVAFGENSFTSTTEDGIVSTCKR
ncbi:MAG: hypothetical protein RIR41_2625 [Pseudomonadota bacterium]|jgi:hypothetical protein